MKKILFLLLALLPLLGMAQQKGTIEYLDANPCFGDIMLGDSITYNLRKLDLLGDKPEKGGFRCKVSELDLKKDCYKMGDAVPFAIFVDVDNYLIKNILVFVKIGNTEELQVIKWLMRNYGDSKEKEPLNWFGKKASVMAGYSDDLKTFYVHFCDLTQLKK